jgi:L-lactate dehydrogenase (cytochrome)
MPRGEFIMFDRIATVADMRELARSKMPRPVFDYMVGAAFGEITLRANTEDFDRIRFRPRGLRDVSKRNLATTILGHPASMPVVFSPIGLGGVIYGGAGEIPAARAAKAAGVPYTLGMLSVATIEEVHAAAGPFWFQMCMLKDRGLMRELLARAAAAGSDVLVLTTTWAASGLQSRMVRNAMNLPPKLTPRTLWDFATKPRWLWRSLTGKKPGFNNFGGEFADPSDLVYWVGLLDSGATWNDIEWLRGVWNGKILVKGVCGKEDARLAIEHGADAVSVSNHGGNQLDSAASTISMLPDVVEGIDGRGTVLIDGGLRSGQDILKALALGADACFLARAFLFGLGAGGQAGVAKVLDIIRYELDVSLALTGLTDVHDASPEILVR